MRLPLPTFLVAAAATAAAATDEQIRDFWFSGAEISRFDLVQSRYGAEHPGHAEFIFVTEPFLVDRQVKHEGGPGESVPVLKLNALRTFNTGIYSYRTMRSTFQPIDLERFPQALKSNTSVQDWCGQVFEQFNRTADGWRFELRSYFQGAGDRDRELSDSWLEDGLWTLLRLDPGRLPTGSFEMIPGSLFTRFQHLETGPASATGELSEGSGRSVYTVRYPAIGRRLSIVFDTDFPHVIREWTESLDGSAVETRAVLADRLTQVEYWSRNRPADRELRTDLGLAPVPD